MRIPATLFVLFLLVLSALAGGACKRPATGGEGLWPTSMATAPARMLLASRAEALPSAAPHPHAATTLVFCHPRADQLADGDSLSAAAAQVAFDMQANNDDRTEMMELAIAPDIVVPLLHRVSQALPHALPLPWVQGLKRPPRILRA